MSIQSIKSENHGLNIFWNDGSSSCFPWLWIRDHSESEDDLHPESKQRQIDVFTQTPDDSIINVTFNQKNRNVIINWADHSQSIISFDLLESMALVRSPSDQALNNGNTQIDLSNYDKGVYTISVTNENGLSSSKKIIIQ